jgi:hypothetical protein
MIVRCWCLLLLLWPLLLVAEETKQADPPQDPIPSRHELPWDIRQGLPEIKLTVWHYDEKPELRWAKINGEHLAEGQVSEGGVEVERISVEGVICRFQGQSFLVDQR